MKATLWRGDMLLQTSDPIVSTELQEMQEEVNSSEQNKSTEDKKMNQQK